MPNINHQLQSLQTKLQQLLQQFKQLQKENTSLKKEIEKANLAQQTQQGQLKLLQEKLHVAQLGTQHLNDVEKKELTKKINGYLKEIDHCLSLLHAE